MSVATIKLTPTGLAVLTASFFLILVFYLRGTKINSESEKINLKKLLTLAIKLSEDGGKEIVKVHKTAKLNTKIKGKTNEGANDPRTDADLFSHRIIIDGFNKQFPQLEVISEEHDDKMKISINTNDAETTFEMKNGEYANIQDEMVLLKDLTVWVDPLDATQEFTEGLLQYVTTMICVAFKGKPIIGVIHKPFYKQTFWGWSGVAKSSNLNGNDRKDGKSRIIISRSHAGMVRDVIAGFGNDTEVVNAGGAGYKTLQVISGDVDAYVHITEIKKWDLCAANALLNCLDGKMTTLNGFDINYDSQSSVVNHGGLLGAMKDHGKYLNLLKAFRPNFE